MPEEQITEQVLGSECTRKDLFELRDMLRTPAWGTFISIIENDIKLHLAAVLGGDRSNEDLQRLAGQWQHLEALTVRFPQELAEAIEEINKRQAEAENE